MELVETQHGLVGLDRHVGDRSKPLLLVINGAYPPRGQLGDIRIEGVETALLELPGYWAPTFATYSVENFAGAYDEVIAKIFPRRRIILLGVSTGAIVALGMMASETRAVVAVEPFLSTRDIWPLRNWLLARLPFANPELDRFASGVFGVSKEGCEVRDYPITTRAPLWVVAGSQPLMPPRPLHGFPSLTSETDRLTLQRLGAELSIADAGHDVPAKDRPAIMRAVREALLECQKDDDDLTGAADIAVG